MKQSDSDLCMYSYADEDTFEIKDSWEKQISKQEEQKCSSTCMFI